MTCTACAAARRAIALLFGQAAKPTIKPKISPEVTAMSVPLVAAIERRSAWGK